MFLNMRSALLQTISATNYINWGFNNPAKAAAAFGNQKQFWTDFSYIWNSPMLKQRRAGLKYNVQEAELAAAVAGSTNKAKAAVAWLIKKGFTPTQIADSFAISSGGATYYRNAVKSFMKQGLSKRAAEKKAWLKLLFRSISLQGTKGTRHLHTRVGPPPFRQKLIRASHYPRRFRFLDPAPAPASAPAPPPLLLLPFTIGLGAPGI